MFGYVTVNGEQYFCGMGNTARAAKVVSLGNLIATGRNDLKSSLRITSKDMTHLRHIREVEELQGFPQ